MTTTATPSAQMRIRLPRFGKTARSSQLWHSVQAFAIAFLRHTSFAGIHRSRLRTRSRFDPFAAPPEGFKCILQLIC